MKWGVVRNGALGAVGAALAGAVALLWHGPALTVAWSVLGLGLLAAGLLARRSWLEWAGLAVLGLAGIRLLVWDSYPELVMRGAPHWFIRLGAFAAGLPALHVGVSLYKRLSGDSRRQTWLAVAAHVLTLWGLTWLIAELFDGRRNGRVAAHEALAITACWALYGLGLALFERRIPLVTARNGARILLGTALSYFLLGALEANARWALPGWRFFTYVSLFGSIWLTEYLCRGDETDREVGGLLSLSATLTGFPVGGFEVVRWTEPLFNLPPGQWITPALLAWQESLKTYWTVAVWGLYALGVMAAGVRMRSSRTRTLAALMYAVTLGYLALSGMTNMAAPGTVRVLAFGAGVLGAGASVWLARRTKDQRLALEASLLKALAVASAGITLAWGALEAVNLLEWL